MDVSYLNKILNILLRFHSQPFIFVEYHPLKKKKKNTKFLITNFLSFFWVFELISVYFSLLLTHSTKLIWFSQLIKRLSVLSRQIEQMFWFFSLKSFLELRRCLLGYFHFSTLSILFTSNFFMFFFFLQTSVHTLKK